MITPIRTRFAPSPTGNLHIGGARSALFSYLWAKKNNGTFILRIEDTDQAREKEGSLEGITEGLRWLGIQWDEGPDAGGACGPYIQSLRTTIYQKYIDQLLKEKKAYRCFCTPECLEQMRKEQQAQKKAPQYDQRCRMLGTEEVQKKLAQHIPFVVRLAVPEQGSIIVHDLVRGNVTFQLKDIDDQVLMKSDGFPTYHLANVVDDHLMGITHVIRGEEWLPSTPKHTLLYQFFKWEAPQFAHLSLLLSKEGGKMSKRHGATALLAFRDNGYIPEAIVNFIALLGWNPKTTEEFFSLDELIQRFDIAQINKANPVFETEKLDWMNQQYMKKLTVEDLITQVQKLSTIETNTHKETYHQFLQWFSQLRKSLQESIWKQLQERTRTLLEVAVTVHQSQTSLPTYDPALLIWKKSTKESTIKIVEELLQYIETLSEEQFESKILEELLFPWIKQHGWGNGDVLWPMRFALSGEQKSPSPFELAELLGKKETVKRLYHAKNLLNSL
ncbi:MAG TPA: glutamate--tRNA ligase [Patescibacteria group bacterium]|nr:glutamate--tRNA ligase [Patescibacteria group bacterium]